MADGVKTVPNTRAYDASRRRESAQATRRRVIETAMRLFVEFGYGATSLQAIADDASVSVQTIYATFGNKRTVLAEALDVAIAGDDEQVTVNDRDWMADVWTAPTTEARLSAYAGAVTRIMGNAADMFLVLGAAAAAEPALGDLDDQTHRRRRVGAARVIDAVREVGPLAPHLTPDAATDVLWALNSPELYHQLVRRAGWTTDRYQEWLAGALRRELLPS